MTLIDFMHAHWFLTWLLAWGFWGVVWLVGIAIQGPYRLVNRLLRLIMVLARGWPPAHLDADGDWRPEPKADTAATQA